MMAGMSRRPGEIDPSGIGFRLTASILIHGCSGGDQGEAEPCENTRSELNLLLLHESTNYLDIVSIRWLIQFLRAWKNEIILVTHDRAFMDSVTTHTMGI